jgi:hypothetical protein
MAEKRADKSQLPAKQTATNPTPEKLLADLRSLIQASRSGIAQAVHPALVLLDWQVCSRIRTDVLPSKRAGYGEKVLPALSARLAP